MPIQGVIFDIGGVLETTPPTGWEDRWSTSLGIRRDQLQACLEPIFLAGATGGAALPEIEDQIRLTLGLNDATLAWFMDELWTDYLGTLNHQLGDYFSRLRPRYRTAILSNSFVGAREREQELYGFAEMCDVIVYSHEEGLLKPDARFYRIACDRLGIRAEDCVLVDDVPAYVDGARFVGMHAITFVHNEQAIRELNELLDCDR